MGITTGRKIFVDLIVVNVETERKKNSHLDGKQAKRPTLLKACLSIANFNGACRPSYLRNIFMSRSKTFFSY